MTVNVAVKMISGRITDRLVQFHQFCRLRSHVNADVGRNSISVVRQPFDRTGIFQRCYPNRRVIVVNLRIEIIHFKLGNVFYHAAHFAVAKNRGAAFIKQRDLAVIYLCDIL